MGDEMQTQAQPDLKPETEREIRQDLIDSYVRNPTSTGKNLKSTVDQSMAMLKNSRQSFAAMMDAEDAKIYAAAGFQDNENPIVVAKNDPDSKSEKEKDNS